MALGELREALTLLKKNPVFLVPGTAGGIFIATTWLAYNISGPFFSSRLLLLFALLFIFLISGMFAMIKTGEEQLISMLKGGVRYFFRILLPQMVIVFSVLLVFIICMITFSLVGLSSDAGLLTVLTIAIMVPTLILTSFFDTAAVFEDCHVFESIQRSVILVSTHMNAVLSFFALGAAVCAGILFGTMILWEALLFDKLKPIMDFTEAQREAFTPEQLIAMIGPEGIWVTALVLFIAFFLIIPIVYSFKAVFFRKMASSTVLIQQQMIGEFDSKGRWYKY
jgi:hypothetical protein